MGRKSKTAGKWMKSLLLGMKSLLLGKKSSKPKLSQLARVDDERIHFSERFFGCKAKNIGTDEDDLVVACGVGTLVCDFRNADFQEATVQDGSKDPGTTRLEESAAIKIQAALRGYMARRAFWALKGTIKLQALVRGRLVRRQAVSTLYCMLGIVNIQALARGKRIRHCDIGIQLQKNCTRVKPLEGKLVHPDGVDISAGLTELSTNAFPRMLLASSPVATPLRLRYEYGEMNSVLNWLERWSASQFWKPITKHKEVPHLKSLTKEDSIITTVDTKTGKLNPSAEIAPNPNADSVPVHFEIYNRRGSMRKVSIPSADCVHNNPQHELEKVKRNLRKVHNPIVEEGSVQSEIENGKLRKELSSGEDALELMKETAVSEAKLADAETSVEPQAVKEAMDPLWKSKEDIKVAPRNKEVSRDEDLSSNEEKKLRRRSWFQPKEGGVEKQLQSRIIMPSYMAVTESAKAKLRGQSSPSSLTSGQEYNSTKGNSLSRSIDKKTSLVSPREQKSIQGNVKGGNGNVKVNHGDWRR